MQFARNIFFIYIFLYGSKRDGLESNTMLSLRLRQHWINFICEYVFSTRVLG